MPNPSVIMALINIVGLILVELMRIFSPLFFVLLKPLLRLIVKIINFFIEKIGFLVAIVLVPFVLIRRRFLIGKIKKLHDKNKLLASIINALITHLDIIKEDLTKTKSNSMDFIYDGPLKSEYIKYTTKQLNSLYTEKKIRHKQLKDYINKLKNEIKLNLNKIRWLNKYKHDKRKYKFYIKSKHKYISDEIIKLKKLAVSR